MLYVENFVCDLYVCNWKFYNYILMKNLEIKFNSKINIFNINV